MPKRTDLASILILGSGPIVIGQGCEFDYSGTQACRALKEEGYRVVLINSNPATIMTDPQFADATYVEPITVGTVEKVLRREKDNGTPVDAVLPTLGGQTGLNTAMAAFDAGVFEKFGVEMIGADRTAIFKGEDRQVFKDLMVEIGLKVPVSKVVHSLEEGEECLETIGLPLILRPAFTLGGTGGGIAYSASEFREILRGGLDASPVTEVLVEQSVLGWKEYELEVIRDKADNAIVICSIENIDPMGVHTGDSITVAPQQTLTDKEYQRMRDAALAVIRAVGVETGGSNIQFGVNPANGEQVVIEMNPRVSRSSALASKATGFPIAKIAAKLAVGYTLDELPNDITRKTPACFEPSIDYVVVKFPRWTFEKFPETDETLTTQMKSVGEAMAIGRTFKEAFQKGIRSLEVKRFGYGLDKNDKWLKAEKSNEKEVTSNEGEDRTVQGESAAGSFPIRDDVLTRKLRVPSQGRLYYVRYALKQGWSVDKIHELTKIDPWFLGQFEELVAMEKTLDAAAPAADPTRDQQLGLQRAKQLGYSDIQLQNTKLTGMKLDPVYKLVDTCAAEFEAETPYYYSTYETPFRCLTKDQGPRTKDQTDDEIRITDKPKVIIIGGGPNRIGQGIEFDYCCVQAAFAMRELGYESVMINSNPETVSTDYDTSDLLFFEPLTHEDVLNVCERVNGGPFQNTKHETPNTGLVHGVIVQFGGQTPLNLADGLKEAGVPILGTSVDAIDRAGDRERFRDLLQELGLQQPANGIARSVEEARAIAKDIGYPVLVRPSFVLGGRAMEIVSDEDQLNYYMANAVEAADDKPILVDKFLDAATEVDVDLLADFDADGNGRAVVAGVMEHIEEAGIHSGDSA
ncbi:MAG: carbamoyl-phosphate synthase large subunit, partial [Planctomycetota bacterium]